MDISKTRGLISNFFQKNLSTKGDFSKEPTPSLAARALDGVVIGGASGALVGAAAEVYENYNPASKVPVPTYQIPLTQTECIGSVPKDFTLDFGDFAPPKLGMRDVCIEQPVIDFDGTPVMRAVQFEVDAIPGQPTEVVVDGWVQQPIRRVTGMSGFEYDIKHVGNGVTQHKFTPNFNYSQPVGSYQTPTISTAVKQTGRYLIPGVLIGAVAGLAAGIASKLLGQD